MVDHMAYMYTGFFFLTAQQTGAKMHKYRHNVYTQTCKTFLEHIQSVSCMLSKIQLKMKYTHVSLLIRLLKVSNFVKMFCNS